MIAQAAGQDALVLPWWDHQRAWLQDASRLRVCCKARQIGMSTVLATEALHAAVYGETTVIVSASQRQAAELLRKAIQLREKYAWELGRLTVVLVATFDPCRFQLPDNSPNNADLYQGEGSAGR